MRGSPTPVRPEPGFELYAPCVPQARRGRMSVWVGVALVLAILAAGAFVALRHLDRPALSDMRGTIHEGWTAPYGPARHREAKLETGDGR